MMRRLTSKKVEAKKVKRNQIVLGIFLIFIMMFSVLGYGFGNQDQNGSSEKINYNGYEFISQDGFWMLNFQDIDFFFKYNPNQIIRTDSTINLINSYQENPLYIYSEDLNSEYELNINLNRLVPRIQNACLSEEECQDTDSPIKTCEDHFIIIKEDTSARIEQDNNCVFIKGNKEDLVKLTDDFLLKILGI